MRAVKFTSAIRFARVRPPKALRAVRTTASPLGLHNTVAFAPRSFTTSIPKFRSKENQNMAPKLELKTPKGTRDWDGKNMLLREHIFDTSEL